MIKKGVSRLDFLKISAVGAGAVLLPSSVGAAVAPKKDDKKCGIVRLGFIGLGQQAMGLLNDFISMNNVEVVAGCDVYAVKNERFKRRVTKYYAEKGKKAKVDVYENYQDLLARIDIDAVVIATPDHQHAIIGIAACKAKKDIYLEKPLTFTIKEGRALCEAVRQNCRILQVGSQQRSGDEFKHATKMVREGKLGKLRKVLVSIGEPPAPYDLPKQEIPAGLNWDKWLGPLPTSIHYNEKLAPSIEVDPERDENGWAEWRYFKPTGGGMTTDWGAHMFDIAQWGLGKDLTTPVRIIPPGCDGEDHLTFVYDSGLELHRVVYRDEPGVKFIGEKGFIDVGRDFYKCSNTEWDMPKVEANDTRYEERVPHLAVFIDSVISRIDPNVPVEVGHSTCTMCTLGNIAYELKRPLDWNPIVEKFVDDPEADKMLHYKYREGYSL